MTPRGWILHDVTRAAKGWPEHGLAIPSPGNARAGLSSPTGDVVLFIKRLGAFFDLDAKFVTREAQNLKRCGASDHYSQAQPQFLQLFIKILLDAISIHHRCSFIIAA